MTTTQTPAPAQPVTTCRPALRVTTEWAVAYGCPSGDPNEAAGILEYDDEAEATEMLGWLPEAILARRTRIVGPWECAADDERASGLALVICALDEAAADRDERARYARHEGCGSEAAEHTQRAGEYRQARDELLEACRG